LVSQEERSIFWEVIVSVVLSKNVYMNMCPILNGFHDTGICLYSGLAWAPSIGVPGGKVIVSVILSKNVYMNMCPIPNGFRDRGI